MAVMWGRHVSIVPKGYLRYQVLRLLNTNPMSGSEIMKQLDIQTAGRWKPSPGSIYPLLAWLQDNSYIEESSSEAGVKRYKLTESGRAFLGEHEKLQDSMRDFSKDSMHDDFSHGLGFEGLSWHNRLTNKHLKMLRRSVLDMMKALREYYKISMKHYSEEEALEVKAALDEATEKINVVIRRERDD
jgi:DNA-binding PadR family transcriptional regulator